MGLLNFLKDEYQKQSRNLGSFISNTLNTPIRTNRPLISPLDRRSALNPSNIIGGTKDTARQISEYPRMTATVTKDIFTRPIYASAPRLFANPFNAESMRRANLESMRRWAAPLEFEKKYNKNIYNPNIAVSNNPFTETANQLLNNQDARSFVARAAEGPTYLYGGVKGLVKNPTGNIGTRILKRTIGATPEALIDTGIRALEKKSIKEAPQDFATTLLTMSALSNLGGEWARRGMPVGNSIEDISKKKPKKVDNYNEIVNEIKKSKSWEDFLDNSKVISREMDNPEGMEIWVEKGYPMLGYLYDMYDKIKGVTRPKAELDAVDVFNRVGVKSVDVGGIPIEEPVSNAVRAFGNKGTVSSGFMTGFTKGKNAGMNAGIGPSWSVTFRGVPDKSIVDSAKKAGLSINIRKTAGGNLTLTDIYAKNVGPQDQQLAKNMFDKWVSLSQPNTLPLKKPGKVDRGKTYYHGTNKVFDKFDKNMAGEVQVSDWGPGIYFTDSREAAKGFAKKAGGDIVMERQLPGVKFADGKKLMKDSDFQNALDWSNDMDPDAITNYLKSKGYDGIKYKNKAGYNEFVVFDPDKIKSLSQSLPLKTKGVKALPKKQISPEINNQIKTEPPTNKKAINPQQGKSVISDLNQASNLRTSKLGQKDLLKQPQKQSVKISPSDNIIPQARKQINTETLNISDKARRRADAAIKTLKNELEDIKGRKLSNKEVVEAANASDLLRNSVTREQTKKATAAITKLRQAVSAGAEGKGLSADFIENLKTLKSFSADTGRRLQAFSIGADPNNITIKEKVIKDLISLDKTTDEILKASKGVDFDNPKQVTAFYRKFVKPSMGEIIDEYRYINLLSSPKTHIVNTFSNAIQVGVLNPATKLYSGGVDFVGSAITGKARNNYIGEVPAYTKGAINSIGDAISEATEVLLGNKQIGRPDVRNLPTGNKMLAAGQIVPRALEAGDVLFRRIAEGGEKNALAFKYAKSGIDVADDVINKEAADRAAYYIFRGPVDPSNKTGQGAVLSGIDKMTSSVYKLRKVPGARWFIPFVQTPMNIVKQGVEYSPLGISTLYKNTNKTEQIAKSLVGSTVMMGAGFLAMKGDSTWSAPTSEKDKEVFYASGRKPYSIKIGDKWYSYSRLGPLAYPIAMAAAIKHEFEQNPKAQTSSTEEKISRIVGDMAKFFTDQSYMRGIGDLVKTVQGDTSAGKQSLSNLPRQLIPLSSLLGWVARQVDPIYRKSESTLGALATGIPFLSKTQPAYTDPLGNESIRDYPTINSFSPIDISKSKPEFELMYQDRQKMKVHNAKVNNAKEEVAETKQPQTIDNTLVYIDEDGKVRTKTLKEETKKTAALKTKSKKATKAKKTKTKKGRKPSYTKISVKKPSSNIKSPGTKKVTLSFKGLPKGGKSGKSTTRKQSRRTIGNRDLYRA